MPISAEDFKSGRDAFEAQRLARARRAGPCYCGAGVSITPFHDQHFGLDLEPVGVVNCPRPLRVGAVNQGLEVMLLASPGNADTLIIPAGSTVTMTFLQGDAEDGTFEDVGPSICVKAPADGMQAEPCHCVCRFPLPNFSKPWLMVSLEFAGAITGGKVDCVLNLMPR